MSCEQEDINIVSIKGAIHADGFLVFMRVFVGCVRIYVPANDLCEITDHLDHLEVVVVVLKLWGGKWASFSFYRHGHPL